jgi:hypothetical protein
MKMATWKVTDADTARDLRVDTETEAREKIKDVVPEAPDFTKMRGPSNKFSRRIDGRNN